MKNLTPFTKALFIAEINKYIAQEMDYIREHNQIKEILKQVEGKEINGRTLNEKRLSAFEIDNGYTFKFDTRYGMYHIQGKYSHLIGYQNGGESTIQVEETPTHRGFIYLDACNGRAAQERINKIKSINIDEAFKAFQKIHKHLNGLVQAFAEVENLGLDSFNFPVHYYILNMILPENKHVKLSDFYYIAKYGLK